MTAHQCSGGATWQTHAVESRIVASSNLAPNTNRLVAQSGRGNALRPHSVSARIRPSLPCARSPTVEAAASRAVQCWFESSRAHQRSAPVADGEAGGFQTRLWVFESPLGCHAPQQQVASGRAATSACAVRIRGGAPIFREGGVDELLKSPVPKTGVSPKGPPRVEFPPPPPNSLWASS